MAFDFSDLSEQRFASDLQQAAGFKPLIKKDLEQAYSRYKDVGVKMGRVKGKSDAQLYKQATDDVLKWWKLQKSKTTPTGNKPATPGQPGAPTSPGSGPGSSGGGGAGSGGAGSGGSGSGRSGTMLPDTAAGGKYTGPTNLKPISQPLNKNYMNQQLQRSGFPGARPPLYALKNQDAFDSWLARAVRIRQEQEGRQVAVRAPVGAKSTGTKVTTSKPKATNRAPVIR